MPPPLWGMEARGFNPQSPGPSGRFGIVHRAPLRPGSPRPAPLCYALLFPSLPPPFRTPSRPSGEKGSPTARCGRAPLRISDHALPLVSSLAFLLLQGP